MKTYKMALISGALAMVLAACAGSPQQAVPTAAQSAAVQVDAAATKDAMVKEEAVKKDEMAKADATKDAMAKEEAMKKDEMAKADATKDAMAKEEAMKKDEMAKADATKGAMAKEAAPQGAMMIGKGDFNVIDATHFANGQASIEKSAEGKLVVRFANFSAADGPDLYVLLSGHPDPRDTDALMKDGSLELGQLISQSGNQDYALPADFDPAKYKSVVIYCKRFSVIFSTATLK